VGNGSPVLPQFKEIDTEDWLDDLVCPKCETHLRRISDKLLCGQCNGSVPILNGIPQFATDFPYWGEIPRETMIEVNRRAATGPWKAALLDFNDPVVQRASGMILNLDRANWQYLLDLPPASRVLDVGAGTGTNSHSLARHYREVVALEPVQERIEFMRQRFSQEQLSNIRIVRSSLWSLPFAPNSFDLVAMNGVLEWVPEGRTGDPKQLQTAALEGMFRLLRPDGYLYVGIENRTLPGYFIGYPDPHSGMPFVTILPRPLAHWFARRRGQKFGYRNYLYSSRGYRNLLAGAGFRDVEVYLALPSYNHPRFLIPMKGGAAAYYFRNFARPSGTWLRRLAHSILLKAGILKHLEYSYVILARK
jgi:ubiquinone/menaquinone biosynthesis C-methylase UbiE